MPAKIIALVNEKGGVGKTATAVNLAAMLAEAGAPAGKKILLVDVDPQGSAVKCVGQTTSFVEDGSIAQLLLAEPPGRLPLMEFVHRSEWNGHLDYVPNHYESMLVAEQRLTSVHLNPVAVLQKILAPVRNLYDHIIIDSGPSAGIFLWNVLLVADYAIVPTVPDYVSIEGLPRTMGAMKKIRAEFGRQPQLMGILPTIYRKGVDAHETNLKMLHKAFPEKILPVIPINIDVPEAFSRRLPVHRFNPDAPATKAYASVTKEVIRRG